MSRTSVEFHVDDPDAVLAELVDIGSEAEFQQAMDDASQRVQKAAQKYVTQPGYPGDKPGLKPLRDTIGVVTEAYPESRTWVRIVGPQWPAGAHGYNVEHGHEGPAPAPEHPYMAPAIASQSGPAGLTFEQRVTSLVGKRFSDDG